MSALPETWLVHLIRLADDDPDVTLVRLAKEEEGVGISMGLFCSVATACFIGFSKRVDALPRLFALLALCFSTAFVDFSTSGLENPLSHLLVVVIYASARRDRSTLRLAILSSWLALNRLALMPV